MTLPRYFFPSVLFVSMEGNKIYFIEMKKRKPHLKATVLTKMSIIISCDAVEKCFKIFPGIGFHTGLIGMIILPKLCCNEIYVCSSLPQHSLVRSLSLSL